MVCASDCGDCPHLDWERHPVLPESWHGHLGVMIEHDVRPTDECWEDWNSEVWHYRCPDCGPCPDATMQGHLDRATTTLLYGQCMLYPTSLRS